MGAPAMGGAPAIGGADLGTPADAGLPPMGSDEEEATPPAPEVGREKRESVDYSRRLGILLNSKKK